MPQCLPYRHIEFDNDIPLEKMVKTADDADTGYFVDVDSKYTDKACARS